MAGLQFNNTEVEHYGMRAQLQYQHSDRFGETRMDFYGARPAESVNVPVWQNQDAINKADNTDHLGFETEVEGASIPLFAPVKAPSSIGRDKVDTRPDLQMLTKMGDKAGQSVGEGKTIRIANFLAKVAFTAGNIVTIDAEANDSTAPGEVKKVAKHIAAVWDRLGVPETQRFGKLESGLFYELPESQQVYGREYGGAASIQNLHQFIEIPYLNFMVGNMGKPFGTDWTASEVEHLALPTPSQFDMTDVVGIFWHGPSWALRHQTNVEYNAEWVPHMQAWLTMARLHMGYKEIQTDGIYVVMKETS